MRDELIKLFDRAELSKYLTEQELDLFDAITEDADETGLEAARDGAEAPSKTEAK